MGSRQEEVVAYFGSQVALAKVIEVRMRVDHQGAFCSTLIGHMSLISYHFRIFWLKLITFDHHTGEARGEALTLAPPSGSPTCPFHHSMGQVRANGIAD